MSNYSQSQGADGATGEPERRVPSGSRGVRRRNLILDTAATLLATDGIEAVNTNAIAARAGISVGSVYQYFANKADILTALGEIYLSQLRDNTVAALEQDLSDTDLGAVVDRVIEPMIVFERAHPAFGTLLSAPEVGGTLQASALQVDTRVLHTIEALLLRLRPGIDTQRARRVALVTKALYKSMSYLVHQDEREPDTLPIDTLLADMKRILVSYLREQLD